MKTITIYEALDGKRFDNASECKVYEEIIEFGQLVGLGACDIAAALDGADKEMGDLLEKLGNRIAKNRLDRGETKRRPRQEEPAREPAAADA